MYIYLTNDKEKEIKEKKCYIEIENILPNDTIDKNDSILYDYSEVFAKILNDEWKKFIMANNKYITNIQ